MPDIIPKIIQEIDIEGDSRINAAIDKIADTFQAAFERIDKSAKKASASVNKSTDNLNDAIKDLGKGTSPDKIDATTAAAENFGEAIGRAGSKAGEFVGNIIKVGAGVGKAGLKIAGVAAGVFALVSQFTRLKAAGTASGREIAATQQENVRLTQQQIQYETTLDNIRHQSSLTAQDSLAEYNDKLGELQSQLQAGQISQEQFTAQSDRLSTERTKQVLKESQTLQRSLDEAERSRRQQIATEADLADQRRREASDAARQRADLAERQAIGKVELAIGKQATAALLDLGKVADEARAKIVDALAPSIIAVFKGIGDAIKNNQGAIIELINSVQSVLLSFGTDTASAINNLVKGMITFAGFVVSAIGTVIIPAFRLLLSMFDAVANGLNNMFGTKFTGQQIVAILLVARFTGLLGALILGLRAVAATMTLLSFATRPWMLALFAIVGVLVALNVISLGGITSAIQAVGKAAFGSSEQLSKLDEQSKAASDTLAQTGDKGAAGLDQTGQAAQGVALDLTKVGKQADTTGGSLVSSGDAGKQSWAGFADTVSPRIQKLTTDFDRMAEAARRAAASASSATSGGSGGGAPTFAGGGGIRGPGTGTSDSVWARVSNGEYIIRAKAVAAGVRRYGAGFWNMLNRLDMRGTAQRFAAGGPVLSGAHMRPAVRMASGGRVSAQASRAAFDLVIDGRRYSGLSAPQSTAEELQREAIGRRLVAAGKPAGWKGGR